VPGGKVEAVWLDGKFFASHGGSVS